MGITGLLPFLKDASTQINVSELRNYTIAIDSYCFLHKGAFGCAEKLARGEDTNSYVLYCLKYIKMLQHYNIKPIMVFDGQHLPAKKATEEKRRKQRKECKKRAQELLKLGKASEAYSYVRRSIDITHKMALNLIKECRNMGIDCIVAPYEADSQLAYLNMTGICQAVVSEDSDLVLFGCKKIIYKLDLNGYATMVNAEGIPTCMKLRPDNYSFDKFRHMCILSGCDYLESLSGIGIKKALKFVSMTANPSIYDVLPKLPSYLKLKDIEVTEEYRKQFMVADATFQHQIVYDPIEKKLKHLTDPYSLGTKKEYLINAGNFYDEDLAFKMALGNVDPFSLKEVDKWIPTRANTSNKSIWSSSFEKSYPIFKNIAQKPAKVNDIKVKKETEKEIESRKVKEDSVLDDELSVYLKNEPTKRKREVDEKEVEPPLSPILRKNIINPFKKISKFSTTKMVSNEVKTSRYFLRHSKSESTISTQKEEISEVEETISVQKEQVSEVAEEEIEQLQEIEVNTLETERSVSPDKLSPKINDESIELENEEPLAVQEEPQKIAKQFVPVSSRSVKTVKKTLVKSKSTSKLLKKDKATNQPTLLSMFNFTKPLQL